MTDAPPPASVPADEAAELALGVLNGEERAAAERRVLADPHFAREVEGWSWRLGRIAVDEAPAKAPPARLWPRIEVAIGGLAGAAGSVVELQLRRSLTVWRSVAGAAGAVAAGLAVVLALPHGSAPAPATPPATSVVAQQGGATLEAASLSSAKGGKIVFVAVYDPDRRELVLTPAALGVTPGRSPELWIIPAGQAPISLGVGQFGKPVRLKVDKLSGKDAGTLAVTLEPEGGSPTGKPTGPVVATGQLQAL